ncbi:MAG: sulfatase-like hydrolase/transferase [Verrucomicrobia bacterium]|nr:sulfatase-like hydrolase/transferase [Verrucomicrobiota bacterium]
MRLLRDLFVRLAAAAVAAASSVALAKEDRPNIVLILSDDHGWADVGWHGHEIKTPNLDKLALGGARLEQFYAQPVCSPTRAALMTGRYPMRHGLQVGVVRPWAQYGLPLEERTLPQMLKEAGYTTAITGKWHLGHFEPAYLPTHRGFDHQYGHYNGALDYFTHARDGGHDWHRDDKVNRDEGYSTHLLAREAVRLINEKPSDKPLFLYVPFNAVHAPHQVPDKYKEPYAALAEPRRTYAGMVAAEDEAIGQIVAAIEAKGLRDNTLFIWSSDNGGPAPGRVTSNGPLRGAKGTLYEGGTRVCAFASWPGTIKPGTIVNAPIHLVDWFPTLGKLAGASLAQKLPLDGLDVWPCIVAGRPSPHDAILLNTTPNAGAIRMGDWKLVLNGSYVEAEDGDPANLTEEAVKKKAAKKKQAARQTTGAVELFDISKDPYEKTNVADAHPEKVKELRARLDTFAREAVEPKSKPRPTGFKVPAVWGEQ